MRRELLNRREVLNTVGALATVAVTPAGFGRGSASGCNFLIAGDWGRDGALHQRDVAIQMGKVADRLPATMSSPGVIISILKASNRGPMRNGAPRSRRFIRLPPCKFPEYVALGNHDYRGNPQAQIDYSKTSGRWWMPNRYFKVPGKQLHASHLDLFVIDTTPMVHDFQDTADGAIAANIVNQDVPGQLRWLDEQLSQSAAPWKIVVGHHTIHSGGAAHGRTPEWQC